MTAPNTVPELAEPGGPGCPHPPGDRRMEDGEQLCLACHSIVEPADQQGIVPRDRAGSVDPTMREGHPARPEGLRHITYDPASTQSSRPYTPDEVEREIVDTLYRLEGGARYLTTQEEKRGAAKLEYELAFARARYTSEARTVAEREDDALLQCRALYSEWQLAELTCRTAKEGMHNLRSKLSGLQTVSRSVNDALRGAR